MAVLKQETRNKKQETRNKKQEIGISDQRKTEIIAFCSGKGGTGKSLMCSCFGYALLRGGQRVLMIDGDPATDGLSLFLLGPKGQEQIPSFEDQNTFIGTLERFQKTGSARFVARAIHRRYDDSQVTYNAIISGKGLYGEGVLNFPAVPDLHQGMFRKGIQHLFNQLRESGEYDYVLVDTRGGFAFESTDLCALADSFIVITDADYTSFYQDRNLVSRVAAAAMELESPSLLRAMIVNKAVDVFPQEGKDYLDTLEVLFRNLLVKEFPIRFSDTHPVPVSIEALLAYKAQKIPYLSAPESMFCLTTLSAFTDILGIVTSRWTTEQVKEWNVLTTTVEKAVKKKQELEVEKEAARRAHEEEYKQLQLAVDDLNAKAVTVEREAETRVEATRREYELKVASLERELDQRNLQYEREFARSEALTTTTIALAGGTTASYAGASGVAAAPTANRPVVSASQAAAPEESSQVKVGAAVAEPILFTRRNLQIVLLMVFGGTLLILAIYIGIRLASRRPGPVSTATTPTAMTTTEDGLGTQPVSEGLPESGSVAANPSSASSFGLRPAPQRTEAAATKAQLVPQPANNGLLQSASRSSSGPGVPSPSGVAGIADSRIAAVGGAASDLRGKGAPPDADATAARLHAQALNEPDQVSMVTQLCRAADLAPQNGQYGKDCEISKLALLGADKQLLKNAQDASDAGKTETAKRFATNVSTLNAEFYREAQLLLLKLNTPNGTRPPPKYE